MSATDGGPPQRPAVAIVGAGWAGLACAVELVGAGCRVTVFEAGKVPGGRARSVAAGDALGTVDNGQHVLIGPYHETFALMDRIGIDRRRVLRRLPLALHGTDGLRLRVPAWPLGLGQVAGLLGARGLGPGGRRALLRLARAVPTMLRVPDGVMPDRTVMDWLRALRQPPELVRRLWAPLCVAALNTPAERASARVFARVLHDGLLAAGADASILVPARPLGELLPEPAVAWLGARGAEVRLGCRVSAIETIGTETGAVSARETKVEAVSSLPTGPGASPDRLGDSPGNREAPLDKGSCSTAGWRLQTAQGSAGPFDAVVVAVAPHQAAALIDGHADEATRERLCKLEYEAIATVHLEFEAPLPCGTPPLRLLQPASPGKVSHHRSALKQVVPGHDVPEGGPGEWLVDHGNRRASVVISAWRRPATSSQDDQPDFSAARVSVSGSQKPPAAAKREGTATDSHADLAEAVTAQLRRLIPGLPAVVASRVIVEKRATFACTPALDRSGHETGTPGLLLAGDHTAGPYPATLEGAVRSGLECADRLLAGR